MVNHRARGKSEERPNMKKTRSVGKALEPAKPPQTPVLANGKVAAESNLSPGRIRDGASATTALLSQILAQQQNLHQVRDWGINE